MKVLYGPLTDSNNIVADFDAQILYNRIAEMVTFLYRGDGRAFFAHIVVVPGFVDQQYHLMTFRPLSLTFEPLKEIVANSMRNYLAHTDASRGRRQSVSEIIHGSAPVGVEASRLSGIKMKDMIVAAKITLSGVLNLMHSMKTEALVLTVRYDLLPTLMVPRHY
jgi:hypothetical protein